MEIKIYQIDAFADQKFSGNPAAICLLEEPIEKNLMQLIAAENNLSETAFIVKKSGRYDIRWFTPTTEVPLCGHATLAAAYVLLNVIQIPDEKIIFDTREKGELIVTRYGDALKMTLPAELDAKKENPPTELIEALKVNICEYYSGDFLMAILDSYEKVRDLKPDLNLIAKIHGGGVIVTSRGQEFDFVSRVFCPGAGIPEDPVTGSAHCMLTPYWSKILGKSELSVKQISARGGKLKCIMDEDKVHLIGTAVLYMTGKVIL